MIILIGHPIGKLMVTERKAAKLLRKGKVEERDGILFWKKRPRRITANTKLDIGYDTVEEMEWHIGCSDGFLVHNARAVKIAQQ